MEQLIKALNIFLKYRNEEYPTSCEQDVLLITGITHDEVSDEDKVLLKDLGFTWSDHDGCWISFRYGSA
jgi:hypothetical protein